MQQESSLTSAAPLIFRFLGRHLPIVSFLILAFASMLFVYWFFSPASDSTAQAIAISSEITNSAPIYKSVPDKQIMQRFRQSPGPIRIGIISGHLGSDSGAVCPDGLTEAEVNSNLAQKVVAILNAQGVPADILEEFDNRLSLYAATAVVSIHADSCAEINDLATGFKIAGSSFTDSTGLMRCMEQTYLSTTQLTYNANTITEHMTDYHVFRTLPTGVPAIIIEVGFMNLDREIITTNADLSAQGISRGILCYLDQAR